ncbi:FtsB family cell division protein [Thermoanaerobacterium thermosaccharolyticum]|jgi:cell division protein DivIC|uniref:Septum formation initiator n=2 Tax=Thermoanaerobacterium thermosaccharolyticum TaxID=1517 RepID=D9TQ55_THETC|nr:septum formation initiator family protein [Thermoanaerobacterium thermosaccharolyticum]TCW42591.1 septum formation initiator [Thermohydrogenium kirishiense]ADL67842.1 Septum formation initiator [Thermoanaerobacterium thermosaccharolyticum DSM 571]AGB17996.1 Septum formation initiator [Thermoanaerobacterium thermosaccharolyticum M0795]KAA5806886.1 septum formation initiator family protein [Thermoanaerobacterium thermosaccharolyticum]MBE0068689.1 septum formation initiator family protein [The
MKERSKIKFKTILLLLFVAYVAFTFVKQQITLNILDNRLNAVTSKVNAAEEENKKLNNQIKYIKTNEFIENEARQKLGLVKKGEIMFVDTAKDSKDSSN